MVLAAVLPSLTLPFWTSSYNGCDAVSYAAYIAGEDSGDCKGGVFAGGIPSYGLVCILFWLICECLNMLAWTTWQTVDTEVLMDSFRINVERQESGESGQQQAQSKEGAI